MTFDNSRKITNLRIIFFLATILLLAYMALAYVANIIKFPLLGMSSGFWTGVLVGIWLILTFTPAMLNYQFISFSDEGENINFRYFSAGYVSGKKNSVEINKTLFQGYKIEKSFFGLITSLILYQKVQQGVAKYPPVYISALTKEEIAKVIRSLNMHLPPA
jgi:hypothetical protein